MEHPFALFLPALDQVMTRFYGFLSFFFIPSYYRYPKMCELWQMEETVMLSRNGLYTVV